MPYTPAGIFPVDQGGQIGVEVEHKQSDTSPYIAAMTSAITTSRSTSPTCSWMIQRSRWRISLFRQGAAEHVALEGPRAR